MHWPFREYDHGRLNVFEAPKAKLITIVIVTVLLLIIVFQNRQSVETEILFFSITMPRAAMLFGSLLVGFAIGLLTAGKILSKRKRN